MEFLGGIEGYNFKPITGYNSFLKGGTSFNRNIEMPTETEFDKVLNMQTAKRDVDPATPAGLMEKIGGAFSSGLTSVNDSKNLANAAQEAFARGEDVSVHDMMIATEKASLSMQMALQVRNKLVSAYTDIKNMHL